MNKYHDFENILRLNIYSIGDYFENKISVILNNELEEEK